MKNNYDAKKKEDINMKNINKIFDTAKDLKNNMGKYSDYEIYAKISEIIEMCNECRSELNGRRRENNKSYYEEASRIMKTDAANYINNYIDAHKHELKCTDDYKILLSKSKRGVMLYCSSAYKSPVNFKGLKSKISQFTNNTVFAILGIDEHTILTEDDYMRFLKIRKNPEYIRPSIQYILDGLYEVDYRNKATIKNEREICNGGIN